MKTKLFSLLFVSVMATWTFNVSAQVQVKNPIYARIPIAPDIVFTVATNRTPAHDYIWIDGYWTWNIPSRSYIWVEGYWAYPPYTGAYWMPGYWEVSPRGYIWVNAGWSPRNFKISYGYISGRYDYYGRSVYYHKPHHISRGYAYSYDHRPDYRGRNHSSSAYYNNSRIDDNKHGKNQSPVQNKVQKNDKDRRDKSNTYGNSRNGNGNGNNNDKDHSGKSAKGRSEIKRSTASRR